MKISIIFFVQVVLVLVLSCESPVQDTKKEPEKPEKPEKIATHDMWDYFNGSWRVTAPDTITATFVFNKSTGTSHLKGTRRSETGVVRADRTDRVKFYRKGSTEIITLIINTGEGRTVVQNDIVQRQGPNRMVWIGTNDTNDPPESLERSKSPPMEFQRNP